MTRHFYGRPELHTLRQRYVFRHEELRARHDAEWLSLRAELEKEVARKGLTDEEAREEWLAVVEEATPLSDEYDLEGLDD